MSENSHTQHMASTTQDDALHTKESVRTNTITEIRTDQKRYKQHFVTVTCNGTIIDFC